MCDQWAIPPIARVRKCQREAQVELVCTQIRYSDGAAVSQEIRRVCVFAAFHLLRMRPIAACLDGGMRNRPKTYWKCEVL